MVITSLQRNFSLDQERVELLKQIVPEVFADGKINWDTLKEALGEYLEEDELGAEHFGLTWAGKREARKLASLPSKGTLVPVPDEGMNEATAQNLFIEGDNLEVLKLLQKSYAGKIKLIYIDPPYNTGQDFIYEDDFKEPLENYLRATNQVDEQNQLLTSNPQTSGRFHANWLNMIYPRLKLARNLLSQDGIIFVSIDDHEGCNLQILMNEIFGEGNFIGRIVWKGATDNNPTQIAVEHEYIICYAYNKANVSSEWKNSSSETKKLMLEEYVKLKKLLGDDIETIQSEFRKFVKANQESLVPLTHYNRIDKKGVYTGSRKVHNPKPGGYKYDVVHPETKQVCVSPANGYRYPESTLDNLIKEGRILFGDDETQIIQIKEYLEDYEEKLASVIHLDSRSSSTELSKIFPGDGKVFPNPKPSSLLRKIFGFCLNKDDIALDFFAGSCSTAQAVIELNQEDAGNRRFIMVQIPEKLDKVRTLRDGTVLQTIADIGRERIRRLFHSLCNEGVKQLDFIHEKEVNVGFKAFRLETSNFKQWKNYRGSNIDDLQMAFFDFENSLVDASKVTNIVAEILLLEGFPLTSGITHQEILLKNKILQVKTDSVEHRLFICLDELIADETAQQLQQLGHDDVFICLDSALTDQAKMQLSDVCNIKTI
jgi:adenine-specific DNA-methyltransferase